MSDDTNKSKVETVCVTTAQVGDLIFAYGATMLVVEVGGRRRCVGVAPVRCIVLTKGWAGVPRVGARRNFYTPTLVDLVRKVNNESR